MHRPLVDLVDCKTQHHKTGTNKKLSHSSALDLKGSFEPSNLNCCDFIVLYVKYYQV